MSGPVWRLETRTQGQCHVCLRQSQGLLVEGEVTNNALSTWRTVCQECFQRRQDLVVAGEAGVRGLSPAYARRP